MKAGPRRSAQGTPQCQAELLRTAKGESGDKLAIAEWTIICADAEQRPEIHLEIFSRVCAVYSSSLCIP